MFDWSLSSIWVYMQPVDMRRSFEFLSCVVEKEFCHSLVDGAVYLFFGNNRRRAKILYFDGTGLVLMTKRLDKGRFQSLLSIGKENTSIRLDELQYLFAGSHINFKMDVSPYRKSVLTNSLDGADEKNSIP